MARSNRGGCGSNNLIAAAGGGASGRAGAEAAAKTDRLATTFGSGAPIPEGLVQGFATSLEPSVEFIGDDFSPGVKAVGEWFPGAARDLLSVPDGHAATVSHGHHLLDNRFFDNARDVTALDWQIPSKTVGGYDFAHFVSQSLSTDDRRQYLDELSATYRATLADAGIDYPEDQFCLDVRRTLLFCLVYPVQDSAPDLNDPRAAVLSREMTQVASTAFTEMGVRELVPHRIDTPNPSPPSDSGALNNVPFRAPQYVAPRVSPIAGSVGRGL